MRIFGIKKSVSCFSKEILVTNFNKKQIPITCFDKFPPSIIVFYGKRPWCCSILAPWLVLLLVITTQIDGL